MDTHNDMFENHPFLPTQNPYLIDRLLFIFLTIEFSLRKK